MATSEQSYRLLREAPEEVSTRTRCEFMPEHQGEFSIDSMCCVFRVALSGFHAFCSRPQSARVREDYEASTPLEVRGFPWLLATQLTAQLSNLLCPLYRA